MENAVATVLGIVAALTPQQTNGNSLWGTLSAPTFPHFLKNNPLPNGFPWGLLTAAGSDPYTQAPNTGVIRSYDFNISRGSIAPDGYQKHVILVNNQYPGPAIEANWGDVIQVTVHNQITGPEEGTSLHWHGLVQKETPWYDGVPGVQQCPISPGKSFTYQFRASLYGTTWYHSHYSAQYSGGLLGPLIIHGPSNANYDFDLGPVFLSDWYHTEYFKIVEEIMKPLSRGGNQKPKSDNNLINGKMNFDCSTVASDDTTPCTDGAGLAKFKFTTGKTHRLRLINAGSEGIQRFSIDGHNLTVIANDFVPIQPYTTEVVTLGIGQRTDVLVTAAAGTSTSAWWMRSDIPTACSFAKQPNALAAVYYEEADTTKAPTSVPWVIPDPETCTNDDLSLTVPYYPIAAATPSTTKTMVIDNVTNATGNFLWRLDGTSFRANYNNPVLLLAEQGHLTYPDEWNVKNFGTNTTVRVVVNNPGLASHPMHLHGHNMQILHEGDGNWDGNESSIVHPNNPQRRDTQLVRAKGHFVMQYSLDNPGVWPFHCHIAWHVSAGLYANLLERPADIGKDSSIPLVMQQTCTDWTAYTNKDVVDQIDSGV